MLQRRNQRILRQFLGQQFVQGLVDGELPKGDVLTVAKIAAIQAAKRTDELIPLCHSLPVDVVEVEFAVVDEAVNIRASVATTASDCTVARAS